MYEKLNLDCFLLASQAHHEAGQFRALPDGRFEPYVNHCVRVGHSASLWLKTTLGEHTKPHTKPLALSALNSTTRVALLHDVVEDTYWTLDALAEALPLSALECDAIRELTLPDECQDNWQAKLKHQCETMRHANFYARIVKIADKYDNCVSIEHTNWKLERKQEYVEHGREVVHACVENTKLLHKWQREALLFGASVFDSWYAKLNLV